MSLFDVTTEFRNTLFPLSTDTYRSRNRRDLLEGPEIDVSDVEKRLVAELGERVCIYENVCETYAEEALDHEAANRIFDWQQIFK